MTIEPSRSDNPASAPSVARRRITAGAVALAVLSFAAGGVLFSPYLDANAKSPLFQSAAAATATQTPAPLRPTQAGDAPRLFDQGAPFSFANLVERVSPAVVTVQVDREERVQNPLENVPDQFRQFFGQNGQRGPQVQRGRALGSGFIIDPTGYIVTNNHVIDSQTKVMVKLPDGREFQAKVVGADEKTDVALLKIDGAKNLPTVAFGDDHHLRVGDWVVAVGNPFGLGGTVTAGIVSAIGRDIDRGNAFTDYIQIDAPINQGNSGGPTFDLTGRVVGMNSAIYSPSGGSVGIGFAIPASMVQATVEQLRDHGSVNRGWLGVSIQDVTPEIASSVGEPNAKGAIVGQVVEASPAAKAGFHQGDVIVSLDGKDVADANDLTRRVAGIPAGKQASFVVLRDGGRRTITADIEKRPSDEKLASAGQAPSTGGNDGAANVATTSFGMRLMPITPAAREQFNIDDDVKGVIVASVEPNGEAADKGFQPGDVIVSVGNKPVRTPADVSRGIAEAKSAKRDTVLFLVTGEQGQHYVALKLDKA